ncbi:Clavaminate synthase-like protein [Viridothelium virens]|uniref:Clavaminate synthase-like protein n=1 Tax=Viridothelium virens TaxID=1048519 RepID=A0A6A6H5H9_VIRVR|nr:Clavaminate synthase-like protein [Viridothelium virens]
MDTAGENTAPNIRTGAENKLPTPPKPLVDWLAAAISNDFKPSDPIWACGDALLSALQISPNQVVRLAHEKLHSFPHQDVPIYWRRLFEEASLHVALKAMQGVMTNERIDHSQSSSSSQLDWISIVVETLDKAAIISGLPGREQLVHRLIDGLENVLYDSCNQDRRDQNEPYMKRRKIERAMMVPNREVLQFATHFFHKPKILHAIPAHSNLPFDQFQDHLLANRGSPTPLIIQDALVYWPALSDPSRSWSDPHYLLRKTLGGRRLVPVEFGRSYTDAGWGQRIITFREFMSNCLLRKCSEATTLSGWNVAAEEEPEQSERHSGATQCSANSEYQTSKRKINLTGYLAQHDLLSQIPSLRSDIAIPDYCYCATAATPQESESMSSSDEPLMNAWLGPGGTISPLHTDPYHNIFCQVVGSKYIRLYAPDQTSHLYPHGIDEQGVDMSNTSQIDLQPFISRDKGGPVDVPRGHDSENAASESPVAERFPLFEKAQYVEGLLGPGDCLYIPKGWWHYVESLSTSFSVSFWWN